MVGRYAQNVAVPKDGGEVVLEVLEGDELFTPGLYGLVVPLESVVCTSEHVDDGSNGLGGGGGVRRRCGGVGRERGECGMGEREETGEVFGVLFLVGDEVRQQPRVRRAVDHPQRGDGDGGAGERVPVAVHRDDNEVL